MSNMIKRIIMPLTNTGLFQTAMSVLSAYMYLYAMWTKMEVHVLSSDMIFKIKYKEIDMRSQVLSCQARYLYLLSFTLLYWAGHSG